MDEWQVVFHETAAGRSPVAEYIAALPAADAARVAVELRLLATFGIGQGMATRATCLAQ
jgi:hypothetical protein